MNIFELFGTIAINNANANKAITDTGNRANKLASSMGKSFDKIGKMAISCGKVIASGLSIGAAAMTAILKSSFDEYAEYEQLVGGVETLFKDSSSKVMGYAKQAYREQGLSANAYMSTVTSFSASLINGLHGDTAAAAEMANIAITDMADNANTFGTSIELIQNAYQGFAKGNFTMLDNLKLGYGGTAEEMARLINDSEVLGSAMKVTAEDINNLSFDVFIAAIHEIQTEMGITGRTAEEAAGTISGSWEALKGAFSNLLVGLISGEDMQALADAFLETGDTFANNIAAKLPILKENFITTFNYIAENGSAILSTVVDALDIDNATLMKWEMIGGTLLLLSGQKVSGFAVMAHAISMLEETVGEIVAEEYQLASGLLDGNPEAIEKYNSMSPEEQENYNTQDEWVEELRQRYEDAGKTMPTNTEILDWLNNNTFPNSDGISGVPISNNIFTQLQTTLTAMQAALDPAALKEAMLTATKEGAKAGAAEGVSGGLSGVTITTGNVLLNDGALVGSILPRLNTGLGRMYGRGVRSVFD